MSKKRILELGYSYLLTKADPKVAISSAEALDVIIHKWLYIRRLKRALLYNLPASASDFLTAICWGYKCSMRADKDCVNSVLVESVLENFYAIFRP